MVRGITAVPGAPDTLLCHPTHRTAQILVYAILPACIGLFIHILQTVADICLAIQLIKSEEPVWGGVTLGLVLAPALLGAIFTLSQPNNWPGTPGANAEYFCVHGFYHVILFPVAAVHRYCRRIFWSMEALYVEDTGLERTRCLMKATEQSSLELYHFLQAFIQGALQCLLQICLVLEEDTFRDYDVVKLQILSILSSLIRLSMTAALYQRFKSQKLAGRYYPWDKTSNMDEVDCPRITKTQQKDTNNVILLSHKPISEDALLPVSLKSLEEQDKTVRKTLRIPSDNFLRHQTNVGKKSWNDKQVNEESSASSSSRHSQQSDYVNLAECETGWVNDGPPLSPAPETPADDVPFSVLVRLTTVRDQLRYSAGVMFEDLLGHNKDSGYEYNEIDGPSAPTRALPPPPNGLRRDDAVSYTVCAIGWFFFLSSRFLALGTFLLFYPLISILVLSITYIIGVAIFLRCAIVEKDFLRSYFSLFLGYLCVFVILELKFRFEKPRRWFGYYFILITCQNWAMAIAWYFWSEWESWWYQYALSVILGGPFLAAACAGMYFVLLKPDENIDQN